MLSYSIQLITVGLLLARRATNIGLVQNIKEKKFNINIYKTEKLAKFCNLESVAILLRKSSGQRCYTKRFNMNGIKKRGAFIVFEGCDRSGKTTQCKMLVDQLRGKGHPAERVVFPDRTTECGKVIDAYLQKRIELPDESIHLLFTSNRWELANKIKQFLSEGITVIVDRYSFSGVAFSAAKGLPVDWCKAPESGLPKPDAVFFLQINLSALEDRGGFGDERYETTSFQEKVMKVYKELRDDSWIYVEANRDRETILNEIADYTNKAIENSKYKQLETLW